MKKKNLLLTFGVKHPASLSFLVWAENPVILISLQRMLKFTIDYTNIHSSGFQHGFRGKVSLLRKA